MELDTAIRLIVISQELLIAAVFATSGGGRAARISGVLLMLSIVGYLYMSDPWLRNALPLAPLMSLLALSVPYCLWLFSRAVFEAPWPRLLVMGGVVLVGLVVWGMFVFRDALGPEWTMVGNVVMHIVSLGIVAHVLWLTLRGRGDDLVDKRRAFRLFFVVIVSAQVTAVLLAELILGGNTAPGWLDRVNVILIALLTIGLAIPMLRLEPGFFGPQAVTKQSALPDQVDSLSPAASVLKKKLTDAMDSGYYREAGLTIGMLAEKLGYPEHQLRRLINGHLGYRNFSEFLNSYRITEAKQRLVDPDNARTPVLTIALDLGYASIGPFNRAFKAITGLTPTDYRQSHLQLHVVDSE